MKSILATLGLMITFSVIILAHFGYSWLTFNALILTNILIILSVLDWQFYCLPDLLTLSLLWIGLLVNIFSCFASLEEAVLGAVGGYLTMYLFSQGFYWCTGKRGLGQGDWKLIAALGAWFGWESLPHILAVASLSGGLSFFIMMLLGKLTKNDPLPFGPFLAMAGWFSLLYTQYQ